MPWGRGILYSLHQNRKSGSWPSYRKVTSRISQPPPPSGRGVEYHFAQDQTVWACAELLRNCSKRFVLRLGLIQHGLHGVEIGYVMSIRSAMMSFAPRGVGISDAPRWSSFSRATHLYSLNALKCVGNTIHCMVKICKLPWRCVILPLCIARSSHLNNHYLKIIAYI